MSPEYQEVDVQHPSIVAAITNMAKEGKTTQEIMKVVGMPAEVVRRIEREVKGRASD